MNFVSFSKGEYYHDSELDQYFDVLMEKHTYSIGGHDDKNLAIDEYRRFSMRFLKAEGFFKFQEAL